MLNSFVAWMAEWTHRCFYFVKGKNQYPVKKPVTKYMYVLIRSLIDLLSLKKKVVSHT